MASPNVHPEFGYLCTSPRLRRDLRVAIYSILLGAVVGAGGIIALGAGGNRGAEDAMDGRAATSAPAGETAPFAKAEAPPAATVTDVAPSGNGGGTPAASMPDRADKPDTASSDVAKTDGAKNDVTKNNVTKNDSTKPDATKTACGDDFWARRDAACLAPKPRRVRVREAPGGAALAGVPIGRTTPAETSAPSAPAASPPDAPQPAPHDATAAPSSPPVAAPKKPQKSTRNANRRRDEAAEDYLWRDERAEGGVGRGYGDESPRTRRSARVHDDDDPLRRGFGHDGGPLPRGPFGPGGLFGALFGGGF
jgi:hypothetical protein